MRIINYCNNNWINTAVNQVKFTITQSVTEAYPTEYEFNEAGTVSIREEYIKKGRQINFRKSKSIK